VAGFVIQFTSSIAILLVVIWILISIVVLFATIPSIVIVKTTYDPVCHRIDSKWHFQRVSSFLFLLLRAMLMPRLALVIAAVSIVVFGQCLACFDAIMGLLEHSFGLVLAYGSLGLEFTF
jgi:hypothetical protein